MLDVATMKSEFRSQMPVVENWAYMDHAAVGPLPAVTRDAIADWLQTATLHGDVHWMSWYEKVESLRTLAAKMVHAQDQEIALIPSTTSGINIVADGFPWERGDNVVTLANEFPSNLFPWLNQQSRGVETRLVPVDHGIVDLDRLDRMCDDRTRLVSASWVGYATGYRIDLRQAVEIAHRHGALFFLDAIQGLGVFPLDVKATGIDFFSADGHKWMLGPEGAGLFYSRQEHLSRLKPLGVGWKSVKTRFNLEPFLTCAIRPLGMKAAP